MLYPGERGTSTTVYKFERLRKYVNIQLSCFQMLSRVHGLGSELPRVLACPITLRSIKVLEVLICRVVPQARGEMNYRIRAPHRKIKSYF